MAFNQHDFLQAIEKQDTEAALQIITDNQQSFDTFMQTDAGKNLLHRLAASPQLNTVLDQPSNGEDLPAIKAARKILETVIKKSDAKHTCTIGKLKITAFSLSIQRDYRATANVIFEIYSNQYRGQRDQFREVLQQQDSEGNSALHHAVRRGHDGLIKLILEQDDNRATLFFARNKNGAFSLALAMDVYRKQPSYQTISIIKQLYYSLRTDSLQTKAVEADVPHTALYWFGFWGRTRPLWKFALNMCGRKDKSGKVTDIDLNLLDLINDIVGRGGRLNVWGHNVTMDLVYDVSNSMSDVPGDMLRSSEHIRLQTFVARTQATVNANTTFGQLLRDRQRFNAKAAIRPCFLYKALDTGDVGAIASSIKANPGDYIIGKNGQLYYYQITDSCHRERVIEIEKSDANAQYYDQLMGHLASQCDAGKVYDRLKAPQIQAVVNLVRIHRRTQHVETELQPISSTRGHAASSSSTGHAASSSSHRGMRMFSAAAPTPRDGAGDSGDEFEEKKRDGRVGHNTTATQQNRK